MTEVKTKGEQHPAKEKVNTCHAGDADLFSVLRRLAEAGKNVVKGGDL